MMQKKDFQLNRILVYQGDAAAWKKLGNSLKLKLAINIADADAAKAGTMVSVKPLQLVFSKATMIMLLSLTWMHFRTQILFMKTWFKADVLTM